MGDKVRNTTRKNVIQPGKKFCRSFDLINYIDKSPEFRELYDQIIKTLKSRLPNFDLFDFDSITVNYNEPMPLHKDTLNKGPSLCFAVGNYRGGELRIHGNTRLVGSQGSTETYPSTTRTRLGYFPS